MDLAKIRKKSLQTLKEHGAEPVFHTPSAPVMIKSMLEAVPENHSSTEVDFFSKESTAMIAAPSTFSPVAKTAVFQEGEHVALTYNTPMEAILAGRGAAGCDDESVLADDAPDDVASESILEFLSFRVSDEIYGINIMDIKEIIKPREVTEVPRAPVFVSGVLSLRGTIIPIIDMRVRLGLAREEHTEKERIIVIKNNNSFSGLLVDEVIHVVQVPEDAVEAAPTVLDGIDRDFVSGLGRSDGRLMIILNLENIADINLY